jgi:hypothetical protein
MMQNDHHAAEHDRKNRKIAAGSRTDAETQCHDDPHKESDHRGTQHEVIPTRFHSRHRRVTQRCRNPQSETDHHAIE